MNGLNHLNLESILRAWPNWRALGYNRDNSEVIAQTGKLDKRHPHAPLSMTLVSSIHYYSCYFFIFVYAFLHINLAIKMMNV